MIFNSKQKNDHLEERENIQLPLFGYELIREEVLPELLGKEHNIILYWAGKSLARKYPVTSIDDLIIFFKKAGWGELSLVKEKKSEAIFELYSSLFEGKNSFSAPLEAGFLAEQIQSIKGFIAETDEESKSGKIKKVIFQVKWDLYDQIESN